MSEHVAPAHSKVGTVTETPYEGGPVVTTDLVCCVHCGFMWAFRPGSGIRRGFCQRCNGFVCGREFCVTRGCAHWRQHDIDNVEAGTPNAGRKIIVSGGFAG